MNEKDTAVIQTRDWKLKLAGIRKWTSSETGKLAEVYGKFRQTDEAGTWVAEDAKAQLVKLEDLLGKPVRLRGIAVNRAQCWWFNYRGTKIYVERKEGLPDWTGRNHFRPMEITGILEKAEMPDFEELGIKQNPRNVLCYIIRNAGWTPVAELLSPEMEFDFGE